MAVAAGHVGWGPSHERRERGNSDKVRARAGVGYRQWRVWALVCRARAVRGRARPLRPADRADRSFVRRRSPRGDGGQVRACPGEAAPARARRAGGRRELAGVWGLSRFVEVPGTAAGNSGGIAWGPVSPGYGACGANRSVRGAVQL